MQQIKNILNQYKYYILCTFLLLIIIVFISLKSNNKIEKVEAIKEVKTEKIVEEKKEEMKEEKIKYLKVDVKGEVKNPGVYELEEGKRVIDSINKAGGLTKNADTNYINLSKKIKDEMIIIVYSKEEIANLKDKENIIVYVEKECECPSIKNDACVYDSKEESIDSNNLEKNDKININTATIEQLQTLSGIGEAKAKSIIEYREENGNFKNIEEIMNVSGIGESAYSKIKDNITV